MSRRERTMRDESYPQRRRTPSFSSTLLDSIYRSIDESKSNLDEDQQLGLFKKETTPSSKQSNLSHTYNHGVYNYVERKGKERMNLRHAVMIEDWMEKQSSSQSSLFMMNSTSSSSDCSSIGGVFSSSETDTSYNKLRSRTKSERTHQKHVNSEKKQQQQQQKQKPQREGGGFARTKLRALKIYGELNQKVKHPISPGSRIASFLSSIFNSGNVKKAKMCYVGAVEDVSFEHKSKSPCFSSSASSFSRRSCMSKTPSSSAKGKSSSGVKRSVRFYPVSVILGEDSQPSGHKYIFDNDPSLLPLPSVRKIARTSSIKELKKNSVMAKEKGAEAAARGFIKGYQNPGKGKFDFRGLYDNGEDEDEEGDDDDALSYSSSDLFELDHLIGARKYQEELPVYETTNLETNKAIANGLRL